MTEQEPSGSDEPDEPTDDVAHDGSAGGDEAGEGVSADEEGASVDRDGASADEEAATADDAGEEAGAPAEDRDEGDDQALGEGLRERVGAADPEGLAEEIASLRLRVEELEATLAEREDELAEREAEVDDLESRLARKQADFQNYKQRQEARMEEEQQRATEDLVSRLLDVRDNLRRALDQDEGADIREGVESTLRQFDDELERENVEVIEPEPGDETDPQRHEVLVRVESDQPGGTVADVHRPGYEMAGKVLRPAQVTVSEGDGGAAEASDGPDDASDEE